MRIHKDFVGGNIFVKSIQGNEIYLENELRDTTIDWFYWAFCVEGASGRELTFHFQENRLGYWGPAVSCNLKDWHWLDQCEDNSFTYRFTEHENKVYFAHHMLYHPDRFQEWARKRDLKVQELCQSRRGRSVPMIHFGTGEKNIILTARHHACESTGSYVLEGVLDELTAHPIPDIHVFCVPFVDYDGVVDGDQGKSRAPYDHNRDYNPNVSAIYPEVQKIRAFSENNCCHYAFDFHAPWHKSNENDTIFIVQNTVENVDRFNHFASLLEEQIDSSSMHYCAKNDHPPLVTWNQPSPNFARTMMLRPECELAFSLENTYFGTTNNKVSQGRLISLGKSFARALRKYLSPT